MQIGVPKEIKAQEYRVGLTPAGVGELVKAGHTLLVERGAGTGAGFSDAEYEQAGARVAQEAAEVFAQSTLIVKVKEPQQEELQRLQPHHLLFTYLHLAPDPNQARRLQNSGATAIAYETVTDPSGALPLLAPMSEVAGRLSIQAAARCLEKAAGGSGVLLGGVPGVPPGKVVILGGGVVGLNAARMAMGLGANVVIIDTSANRLRYLDEHWGGRMTTLYSHATTIEREVADADAVIGAVLIPGAAAPKLVSRDMLSSMRPGSVLVDVAIDQGGCFATSRATTHQNPIYVMDGVVHYCVANMPGAVPRTSTQALTNATLPYVQQLAAKGLSACFENPGLRRGLNIMKGKVVNKAVADALGEAFHDPATLQ
jgi:alanine dehydrogenase